MDLFTLTGIVVINGITEVQGQIDRLMRSAENAARGFSDMSRQVGSSLTSVGNSISGIGDKLTEALTKPIIELTTFGLKYNASMEMMQTNFGVLLSSGEKATILMKKLSDMADVTPFDTEGLSKYTQMLLSMGYTGENVLPMLQKLGDISLGNSEKMGRLTYAVGQIRSNGRLLGSELRQLTELGFNPLEIICKKTGETMEEARERMSDGGISYKEFAATLDEVTSKGGKFYKGMEEGSKTMIGMLSTVKDKAEKMAGAFAKPIFDKLKEILPDVIKLISGVSDGFTKLDGGAKMAILGFAGLVASIGPITVIVGTTVTLLGAFFMALSVLTAPLGLITGAIAVLIGAGALGGLVAVFAGLKFSNGEQIASDFQRIKDKAIEIYNYLTATWVPAIKYLLGDKKQLAKIEDGEFKTSLEGLKTSLETLGGKITETISNIQTSFEGLSTQDIDDFSTGLINGITTLADAAGTILDVIEKLQEGYNWLKRLTLEYQVNIGGNASLGATKSEQKDAARAQIELLDMDIQALFKEKKKLQRKYEVETTVEGKEKVKEQINQVDKDLEAKANELGGKEKKFNKKYKANIEVDNSVAQQQIKSNEETIKSMIKTELKGNRKILIDGEISDKNLKKKIEQHNDEIKTKIRYGTIKEEKPVTIDAKVDNVKAKASVLKSINAIKDYGDKIKIPDINKTVNINVTTKTNQKVTERASGGPADGLTLVGEKGPELLALPKGSYVYNNSDTKKMMSGMGGIGGNIVSGLIGGASSKLSDLASTMNRVSGVVIGTLKSDLQIASPSKIMWGIGWDVISGIAGGLRQTGYLQNTLDTLSSKIIESFFTVKDKVSEYFTSIKNTVTSTMNEIKNSAITEANNMGTAIKQALKNRNKEQFEADKQAAIDSSTAKMKKALELKDTKMFEEAQKEAATANSKTYTELTEEELDKQALAIAKNQGALTALLSKYYPQWQDAGQSFGDKLINGLNSTKENMATAISDFMLAVYEASKINIDNIVNELSGLENKYQGIVANLSTYINQIQSLRDKMNAPGTTDAQKQSYESQIAGIEGNLRRLANEYGLSYRDMHLYFPNGVEAFAKGVRNFSGGWAMVGEKGPELTYLPKGSNVYTNSDTQKMLSGNSGDTIIMNGDITIDVSKIKDITDVINIFKNLKSERLVRGGAY